MQTLGLVKHVDGSRDVHTVFQHTTAALADAMVQEATAANIAILEVIYGQSCSACKELSHPCCICGVQIATQ